MFERFIMRRIASRVLETLAPEPDGKITILETRRKIIKAEVMPSGAKRFILHKIGISKAGKKIWRYTAYAINDAGDYHALNSGQYPCN